MPKIPKIWFVKKDGSGSAVLRADQVARELCAKGLDAAAVTGLDAQMRDGIVVFVKHLDPGEAGRAAGQGNLVVYDIVDKFTFHDFSRYAPDVVRDYFSGLSAAIHPNQRSIADFRAFFPHGAEHRVIHHHWDGRFSANLDAVRGRAGNKFRIGYIGDPENYVAVAPEVVPVFEFERQLEFCPLFTCHYSVRRPDGTGARYKPATKVSIAASVGSNIVTTRDDSALELLGPDYPFFTGFEPDEILEAVRFARESFGGAAWNRGIEIMAEVRRMTSIGRICGEYAGLFKDLC